MTDIQIRYDSQRGCGWRKPGGLYLMAGGPSAPCGKMPLALHVCPTCHGGIKPTRGWQWVDADALFGAVTCQLTPCRECPLLQVVGRAGLLWVGGSYYKTPGDWTREAVQQGVSRRIKALPKGFELGRTWVLVAHRKVLMSASPALSPEPTPAIFHAFKPSAVEYVVKGDETDEQLEALVKRGITPVRVERAEEPQPEAVSK